MPVKNRIINQEPACEGFSFWDFINPITQAHADLVENMKDH